jgi:internalin A
MTRDGDGIQDIQIRDIHMRRTTFTLILTVIFWTACSRAPSDNPGGERPGNPSMHDALRAKNPGYSGQGQFEPRAGGIAAVLRESGISDLSPLKEIRLKELDLQNNPVNDLSPLQGLPLEALYLEGTQVSDLRPLKGMSLRILYLSGTKVSDLSPLRGVPLRELNLLGTQVTDLGPLYGAPLEIAWLNETPVSDLTPLEASPLVSLTIHRTRVANLSPIRNLRTLQRLHVAETPVSDLTPLEGLELVRLIFSPERIRKGIGVARKMGSIREIGTSLEGRLSAATFWEMYDKGEFK